MIFLFLFFKVRLLQEKLAQTEKKLKNAEQQNLVLQKIVEDQQNEIATLKAQQSKNSSKVKPDRALQAEVRRNYDIYKTKKEEIYDYDLKFDCLHNRKVTDRLIDAVEGTLKDSYSAQEISDYCRTYFKHLRDDRNRELSGKKDPHRKSASRRNRLNRKLNKRKAALEAATPPPLSDDQMTLAKEMLVTGGTDYMSSDESDNEDNVENRGTHFKVRRLAWESVQMSDIKDIVDKHAINIANKRQRAKMAYYKRDPAFEVSTRPVPKKLLNWAVDVFYTS